ncbi:MAG: PKD domain-containing protein [Bacteroidales bacterium]|nr:PKD domain-containing protein [Bacteroidales bacterium]
MFRFKSTLFFVLLLAPVFVINMKQANAQKVTGEVFYAGDHVKSSLANMEAWEKLNPPDTTPKWKTPKPFWTYPDQQIDESKIIYRHTEVFDPLIYKSTMDPSPLPDAEFAGLGDNNTSIPPDVNGCAGPDHLMITLNTEVRIQNKTGTTISTLSLGSFWAGLPGASQSFDPKILFDPSAQRWIIVCPSSSTPSASRLLVGASETSDPTGNWNLYALDADPANTAWFDYPSFGFNKNWIVVTGNMFSGGSFQTNVFFVIKKADMYSGTAAPQYTRLTYTPSFTIVPAITYDEDLEDIYLISNIGGGTTNGNIAKYTISGGFGAETLTFDGYINTPNGWSNNPAGNGDFSPQLGTTQKISAGDTRMQNVIYRNGKLWAVHHVFLPAGNPIRSAVQWWELDENGTVLQFGRVDDPTGEFHFTYPTIAVNAMEEILIGYSSHSANQYASASYSFRTADDPPNTLRDRYQFKDGKAKYYKTFGGGQNRWGDYSATQVDPANDLNFWTLQEYAELPSGGYDKWGTWWAYLVRESEPVAGFSANITTVPVGSGVNFTDESLFMPTSWNWVFEGGTPGTSSDQNPQNIIYSQAGTFDVSLTVANNMGSNTLTKTDYITASSSILPDVNFMASDTVPCTGAEVVFTDLTAYNPVSWNWEITPGTFDFVNGTNGSSQNPEVVFNQGGTYSVSLTASNNNGSNSFTKTDYILAGGNVMPYTQTFEISSFSFAGWTVVNPDNGITWDLTDVGGNTPGTRSAFINLRDYSVFGEKDRLISPPFNFSGYASVVMGFQHAYAQRFASSSDSLIIYVSDDCGETWMKVFAVTEDAPGDFATHEITNNTFTPQVADDWCGSGFGSDCYSISLDEWAGDSDIRIMFESVSGFGNNLFIDNVNFTVFTGIPQIAPGNSDFFRVYPNPAFDELVIETHCGNCKFEILDARGQVVLSGNIPERESKGSSKVRTADLSRGIYIIRVFNNSLTGSEKLILK